MKRGRAAGPSVGAPASFVTGALHRDRAGGVQRVHAAPERPAWHFGGQLEPPSLTGLEMHVVVIGQEALGFDGDGVREPVGLEKEGVPSCNRLRAGNEVEVAL